MTKLHRAGLSISLSAIVLAFAGFWITGTMEAIEFSSQYFWAYVILPLVIAAAVTGLSWKWPFIGGCIGVVTPFAFFVTYEMETVYRYLYLAVIIIYFTGGVLLLLAATKAFRSR
jgi:hypothetical protein